MKSYFLGLPHLEVELNGLVGRHEDLCFGDFHMALSKTVSDKE